MLTIVSPMQAQQDPFRWMDFHSAKDQDIVVWVTRSLDREKWTAIREIGVQYDAALVVTTLRDSPQAAANVDKFTVWSVSLTSHVAATPLLQGVSLRWVDWMRFGDGERLEPAVLYDDCTECAASTFFTSFHYDISQHMWAARWMRGNQSVPMWSASAPVGVTVTQVSAVMTEPTGREMVGTWSHFDYGSPKPAEEFIYLYDLDPFSGLERTQMVAGKAMDAMEQRLCHQPEVAKQLARGQDSTQCGQNVKPVVARKPVTTPPANNHGQSQPPGARH
jgi:hypothetical protein